MTCVSLRSGTASNGIVRIDHQPATQAAPTRAKMRNRLRTENSMMRSIMGHHFVPGHAGCRECGRCQVLIRYALEELGRLLHKALLAGIRAETVESALILKLEIRSSGWRSVHSHATDRILVDGLV